MLTIYVNVGRLDMSVATVDTMDEAKTQAKNLRENGHAAHVENEDGVIVH